MTLTIRTNNVPRFTIDAFELSASERQEFDYMDWQAIDNGEQSATFFRFKGNLYDIGEFMPVPRESELEPWDAYSSDSAFSGVVFKWADSGFESVIVGQFFS